ncbi:MAG: hypothetical protein F4Y47_16025 [Acidobacteriia bacterium]|nr:hypothetical protein [Terriglobia bacterium]
MRLNEASHREAGGCARTAESSAQWREWIGPLGTLAAAGDRRWQWRSRAPNMVMPTNLAGNTAGRRVVHEATGSYT